VTTAVTTFYSYGSKDHAKPKNWSTILFNHYNIEYVHTSCGWFSDIPSVLFYSFISPCHFICARPVFYIVILSNVYYFILLSLWKWKNFKKIQFVWWHWYKENYYGTEYLRKDKKKKTKTVKHCDMPWNTIYCQYHKTMKISYAHLIVNYNTRIWMIRLWC